jgi:hypothetical protein
MQTSLDFDFDFALKACASGALLAALADHPPPVDALVGFTCAPSPGEPYGRRLLHRSDYGEAVLVRFSEDTFCAPHDHGDAIAFVQVLRGELVELRFVFDGQDLSIRQSRTLRAPDLLGVPPQTIHCMKGTGDALALHFYAPAIEGMRVYDAQVRRTLVVADECGAWVPSDPALVLSEAAWQGTSVNFQGAAGWA